MGISHDPCGSAHPSLVAPRSTLCAEVLSKRHVVDYMFNTCFPPVFFNDPLLCFEHKRQLTGPLFIDFRAGRCRDAPTLLRCGGNCFLLPSVSIASVVFIVVFFIFGVDLTQCLSLAHRIPPHPRTRERRSNPTPSAEAVFLLILELCICLAKSIYN